MPLFEKIEYINQDFKKSALCNIDDIPSTRSDAAIWHQKAVEDARVFIKKYQGKGKYVENYVTVLILDYMDSIERLYEKQFGKKEVINVKKSNKRGNK